jgi:hypothetical protein
MADDMRILHAYSFVASLFKTYLREGRQHFEIVVTSNIENHVQLPLFNRKQISTTTSQQLDQHTYTHTHIYMYNISIATTHTHENMWSLTHVMRTVAQLLSYRTFVFIV